MKTTLKQVMLAVSLSLSSSLVGISSVQAVQVGSADPVKLKDATVPVATGTSANVVKVAIARPIKAVIIAMFGPEAEPFIKPLALTQTMQVPGLAQGFNEPEFEPRLLCNKDDVCLLQAGMGHANAAASVMALTLDPQFDLTRSYFLIAGVAGIDPAQGTIGTATWSRYLVDVGIAHEIDAREMPKGWKTGYFGIFTKGPGEKPKLDYRTEVAQLDEALLQKVLALTKNAKLEDSDKAAAYRKLYKEPAARAKPSVIQCDTLGGDTWWHGHRLGQHARDWTKLLSDGKATYCTTQQEDNATYNALQRAAKAGKVDLKRLAVLRTGINFDRPHPGQSAYDSLKSDGGGFLTSTHNLYHTGGLVIDEIVKHWDQWRDRVPAP